MSLKLNADQVRAERRFVEQRRAFKDLLRLRLRKAHLPETLEETFIVNDDGSLSYTMFSPQHPEEFKAITILQPGEWKRKDTENS